MRTRYGRWIGGALMIALGAALVQAQSGTAPLIKHTFEESDGGWTAPPGSNGKVSITHDAAHVKEGKGALQFDYTLKKGEFGFLVLPTPDGALAKAKSIRFWVQCDSTAPLAVTLQEHEGGRYVAMFTVPKDRWQQVELSPSDFTLSEDQNDPKDPDNKLDMDQVESVGVADAGQIFAQSDSPEVVQLFNLKMGPRTLYLDEFVVSEETLPNAFSAANADVRLDTFVRPQIGWFAAGDVKLSTMTGKPLEGRGLQADYHQAPGKIIGIVRKIPRGKLVGTDKLALDVASLKPAKLMVQVEEKDGGKYKTIVEIPGEKVVRNISVAFSDLKAANDSHDTNDKLDMDQINQLVIVDLSGPVDMADQDNTLWIGNLRASAAK